MKAVAISYVGNGVVDRQVDVGFQPDLVIVNGSLFRSTSHASGISSPFAANSPNQSNGIKDFNSTGFTVGTSASVNTNGQTYHAVAFKDTGANDFAVGSYTGTGVSQSISGLPFSPNMVAIKGNASYYGWWRTSALGGSNTLAFAGFQNQSNRITSINADGFTLGTDVEVNQNGTTFYWFAFGGNPSLFQAGSYTGNATDDRDITGVNFQPILVWLKANNPTSAIFRYSSNVGDSSTSFGAGTFSSNQIQAFSADGFQVGTTASVNENNTPNYYFAIAAGFTTVGVSLTMKATIINPTVSLTMRAKVRNVVSQTATVRGWVRKRVAGALAGLPYRGVDVMKWTKDTTKSQPSDSIIENIIRFLQENINLTHIAVVLPIDPLSWYPLGYTPAPRSIIGTYQKWADEIHNRGLRILHRPVSFGMEGRENFTHRVGGNRYPQGVLSEIIPTTFEDDFDRTTIYTSITQQTSSYEDLFNRVSLGSTDWNVFGSWSIQNNELICSNVANAASHVLWSKANYTDFTYTAKVKKVSLSGFAGVVFRMTRDTNNGGRSFANYFSGYVLQLRDSNILRVENIATANLAQTTKAWTSGVYYQVKVQCTGANIKIRVWADGTAEPGTWDLDFNDTTYSSGGVGFCPENTNTTAVFDDVFISYSPTSSTVSDWNTVGGWSIEDNAVKCTNAAAQYSNLMYSKAIYKDFTYQAKVKNPGTGITAVIFRLNPSGLFPGYSGYTARIRNNSIFEIEDLSISNLASVSKTFVTGTQYQVKVSCTGSSIQAKVWENGTDEPGAWDISITNSKYTQGSIGFAPENVAAAYFDDVAVSVTPNYNSWLGINYQFIVNNPTLFENGDIWAPFPERTEGIFSDSTSFISPSAPGTQQNYANFFSDLKTVSDYAFAEIDKNVITGWSSDNYSEVRSGWIPQTLYDNIGITAFDYYQNYSQDLNFTGVRAKFDIDAVYASRGNQIVWQEWGPVPDMLSNISSTQGQTVNGFGSVLAPNFSAREVWIREFMTNGIVAAYNEGKLIMFNYWGFWDTGDNDTGLAKLAGSAATYSNIKFRREGWILAEYFDGGSSPQKTISLKAKVSKGSTKTMTMKAKVVKAATKTLTMKAHVNNPTPETQTSWVAIDNTPINSIWVPSRR